MRLSAVCSIVLACFVSSVIPSCPVGYSQGPPCFGGKCFFSGYECMNRKCCKKAVTSTCPTGHLTGPACSSTGTCSSKGYDCMKDINMCCLKLQVISPCLSRLSDGSCKTDTDCKSGYTCKIGTCCKTPVLTPSSCPSFLSAGSCKTDTDCKSGYTCNIGTCCKTLVLPPSTCLSFLSAGSCETDTDCESSYKCESGTCCRSFVAPPSCPRGTYSSGTCAGGRKCDGDCINNLCCKSYTRPSFKVCPPQNRPPLCPVVGPARCSSDDDCNDPRSPGEKCCVVHCGPADCVPGVDSSDRFPGFR